MTLLLYAVMPVDAPAPDDLAVLRAARAAVVHAEQQAGQATGRDAVLAFGRTIERIARMAAVLPMRFGTTVADLEELRLLLAEHEEAWEERLEAVAGCCELIVHLGPAVGGEPGPAHELTGREYLLRRADALHAQDAVRDQVRAVLGPWLRESRSLRGIGPERLAVLVPSGDAKRARWSLEHWAAGRSDLAVAVTGPWPPFSFCEAAA